MIERFDTFKLAELWNTGNWYDDYFQQFMEYERTYTKDRKSEGGQLWMPETSRCLNHCKNMINGMLAEVAFREYYRPCKEWTANDSDFANWVVNRNPDEINKTDFYYKNIGIELKCYAGRGTETQFVDEVLSNINSSKYHWLYHNADLIIYWRRCTNKIYIFYKDYKTGCWDWTIDTENITQEELNNMMAYYKNIKAY